ncbi:hypothetical protein H6G20_00220 [Desertifilum sp. FACHB-1129]|uniref:Uncharacterized protein n=2 Tax=Desertifilum tharense IPPAS B-1220 TaxID=1781255 RepID=A0A1E5QFZ8_9CYAN|nr:MULTISPECIES: hypothetical protein [Desertifilum]MDA0211582.1 hypothetical protein [Cyanobacteria bacterium FC1]MBD2310106.1 hypothetical protein [Desertifilum sp. FACHB-1129]MBD2322090.1 hypothetical protein [Desertifilum sp. FACHB-866]MBD2333831.1 hypothetical protein [Desertifilum sp. FACHB-868]OEJ73517.1 hypothetical protein BH720_20030 [Desertifilum tharense IPPAS B-1220]
MDIYVRSRGFSQDSGYCWVPQKPSILSAYKITDLIQSEAFSIVLGRYNYQLILFVTGLDSGSLDFCDRKIRTSILWVGENTIETEEKLRAIAISLLQENFPIPVTLNDQNPIGFDVNFQQLRSTTISIHLQNSSPSKDRKIAPNTEEQRKSLRRDLQRYKLPEGDNRPLVIVTGIKQKSVLENSGVWRGLSSEVKKEEWFLPKESSLTQPTPQGLSPNQSYSALFFITMLLMGLALFLVS